MINSKFKISHTIFGSIYHVGHWYYNQNALECAYYDTCYFWRYISNAYPYVIATHTYKSMEKKLKMENII